MDWTDDYSHLHDRFEPRGSSAAGLHAMGPVDRVDRPPGAADTGFTSLFDGTSTTDWRMAGSGGFVVVDGRLESVPGDDLGVLWCTVPTPPDFVLRLGWLRWRHEDASGIFLRFPTPPAGAARNPVFDVIEQGFEVQIDEVGLAGATRAHKTGAIFNQPDQRLRPLAARPPAEWNEFEISVQGDRYVVRLNGATVSSFVNRDPARGRPSRPGAPRFIGLHLYPGARVAFRDIRIKPA